MSVRSLAVRSRHALVRDVCTCFLANQYILHQRSLIIPSPMYHVPLKLPTRTDVTAVTLGTPRLRWAHSDTCANRPVAVEGNRGSITRLQEFAL